jgi:hypothetical protein
VSSSITGWSEGVGLAAVVGPAAVVGLAAVGVPVVRISSGAWDCSFLIGDAATVTVTFLVVVLASASVLVNVTS